MRCIVVSFFLLMSCALAEACTGIRLGVQDGSFVHGRTLEFGVELPTSILVMPRGYVCTGTTPLGPGLQYVTKYGLVGAMVFDKVAVLDGMNEKGLAIGTFFFPGFAEYAAIMEENQSRALSPSEFPSWVLSQFATVDELQASLSSVVIAPTCEAGWGSAPPPFHYIVYDTSGKCLVLEPLRGSIQTYDNPLGVLTNSPTFDWHMTNLRNYLNLHPENASPIEVDGLRLAPFGQGSGMVGLPGDFTPPSRFVRATLIAQTALLSSTAQEAVLQLFHLLNLFDIPKGFSRAAKGETSSFTDSTSITCVRDPQSLTYYFKTYEDQAIKVVDLKKFDLDSGKLLKIETAGKEQVFDISQSAHEMSSRE